MKERIERLKKEKNAVILAHYYTPSEVQEIADYVGDSFYLAKVAKKCNQDMIVFCGVKFMGESAKILNPDKKVFMPDLTADCAMAHMVEEHMIEEMRKKIEDLAVVCYINSTTELKCQSDFCVTSSNAVSIVKKIPNKNIFFIPDKNLGSFVAKQVPEKNIILNNGCCPIHTKMTVEDLRHELQNHPRAKVIAHPECTAELLEMADYIGSTSDLIEFAKSDYASEFIVCTENGVDARLNKDNPNKRFYYPNSMPCCMDMKRNTLASVLNVLENEINEVTVDECVRRRALIPLERMLEFAK